jgi:hypothetical protein
MVLKRVIWCYNGDKLVSKLGRTEVGRLFLVFVVARSWRSCWFGVWAAGAGEWVGASSSAGASWLASGGQSRARQAVAGELGGCGAGAAGCAETADAGAGLRS